ncbi:MAG: 1-(5-phosphoribosyl)-5-[(5-phosphoribosylamino)methylideneamino]imidazole-4-carboxamide isomerase [Peptostreptococcaceae bacterium]|nr:1-(5-phosphoribosyl)-5-[(5-phosphoribosylamino)methylideneamino]imidazole-4-carboxamide isomerase [Peptostreptococcaceae bacterium]
MKIFPAIDLKDGKVVRLTQGDYNKVDVFGLNPLEIALKFQNQGAKYLHVVDLDGAKDGELSNYSSVKEIVENTNLFIEVGGGIRNIDRIEKYLSLGVDRVILGTAAVRNFNFLEKAVENYGDKIALGVDAKDGYVAVEGWLEKTEIEGIEFCKRAKDIGLKTVIYTDIATDGAMKGTNLDVFSELTTITGLDIVASGGVSSIDEIGKLKELGVSGVIIGKAIYLGAIDLGEAIKEAE